MSEVLKRLMLRANGGRGISANELARRTGVLQSTISRILRGDSKSPRDDILQPIADYFEISISELRGYVPLDWKVSINELSDGERKLLKLFDALTDKQKLDIVCRIEEIIKENIDIHNRIERKYQAGDDILISNNKRLRTLPAADGVKKIKISKRNHH